MSGGKREKTRGEWRVGVGFDPSGSAAVGEIKRLSAELIDRIDAIETPADSIGDEVARLKGLAQTAVEGGAMWAVKAATKAATKRDA